MMLPDDILAKVQRDFSDGQTLGIINRIEALVDADRERYNDRILRCLLFVARGNASAFEEAVDLAETDCRDLILSAEYDGNFSERKRDLALPFDRDR